MENITVSVRIAHTCIQLTRTRIKKQEPRVGTLPPIEYSVDIPLTAATIFGVEDRKYTLVTLEVYGKFNDLAKDPQTIGDEFFRRCECSIILAAVVPCTCSQ